MRFVNSVVNGFESKDHDPMIPSYLFNDFESKPIVLNVSHSVTKTRKDPNNC